MTIGTSANGDFAPHAIKERRYDESQVKHDDTRITLRTLGEEVHTMLKEVVRSVVPKFLLSLQDDIRGKHALNRTKANSFDTPNLRPIDQIDPIQFRKNPTALASWALDHNTISEAFGIGEYNLAVSPNCRKAIYFLAMNLRPRRVLEIGTNVGGSTLYIATALKRLEDGGKCTSVDIVDVNSESGPWVEFGLKHSPKDYARLLELDNIEFKLDSSLEFMNSARERYGIVFLDGDHSPAIVYSEVSAALRILDSDGVILLHDYYPFGKRLRSDRPAITGPFTAVERILRENKNIAVLPLRTLLGEDDQSNITSLAVLGRKSQP